MLKALNYIVYKKSLKKKVVIHWANQFLMIPVMVENGVLDSNSVAAYPGDPRMLKSWPW